jgi:nucleoid-associated protein YgaU
MDRSARIVLAAGVVLGGIVLAMLFRRPLNEVRSPKGRPQGQLVLREHGGAQVAELSAADRPAAQIEPSAVPSPSPGTPGRSTSGLVPIDPIEPPPALARSYPHWLPGTVARSGPTGGFASRQNAPHVPSVLTHKIVDGDTLDGLAERYLGDADRYLEIYEANRQVLPSPELLPIGAVLRIPLRPKPAPKAPTLLPEKPMVPIPSSSSRTAARKP